MRSYFIIPALTFSILAAAASPALAAESSSGLDGRFNLSLGAWNGSFHQSDSAGHEINIRTLTSLGLELGAGVTIGPVFIEYNLTWLISNHTLSPRINPETTNDPSSREGPYFSPLGLTAGLSIPHVPVEPYAGIEKGTFGFSAGAGTGYSGLGGKVGFNLLLNPGFGLRAEYRKLFASSDDAGSIPSGISTTFDCWYVGIVFGKF